MANIEKFIPFIIQFEAGVNPAGLTGEKLLKRLGRQDIQVTRMIWGATMVGVTLPTYTEYCRKKGSPRPTIEQLRSMPYAIWLDILKTMFWNRWKADEIANQSIAEILVDWVWVSGKYGITIPQKILGVTVDGVVGARTLAAVNRENPAQLFARIMAERKAYIDHICASRPVNNKYKRGWLRRLNTITFRP